MTCIVGVIDKSRVVIGGDSSGVSGYDAVTRKDEKVFRNDDFVIGCTTSFRMAQLLKYSFVPPVVDDTIDFLKYMCTDFVNELRSCFRIGGFLQLEENGTDKGGFFLVGYRDRLFRIESDFNVSETTQGYIACGSGEDYALGSIFSSIGRGNAIKDVVLEALECAAHFNTAVSSPFVLHST